MRPVLPILIMLGLLLAGLVVCAAPVFNRKVTLVQPDGSCIQATVRGDENFKTITSTDGKPLGRDSDGWWRYAWYEASGAKHLSGTKATDACPVDGFIPLGALANAASRKSFTAKSSSDGSKRHRTLVIPVQFADTVFTCTHSDIETMINTGEGSVKDYFNSQKLPGTAFSFSVTRTVTLSREAAFYGKNDEYGQERNIAELVVEGCKAVDAEVDFSQFDHLTFIYAGQDEGDGAGDDHIWSHAGYISDHGVVLVLDGVQIDLYSCTSEMTLCSDGEFRFGRMGKYCHEFGHNLGLPDFYDNWIGDHEFYYSAGLWRYTSLMDGGFSNNDGLTPPYLNAIEREILGAGSGTVLTEGQHLLSPVAGGQYFRIDGSNAGEYYLLECRDNLGWDKYIGGRGLLAYHIDKSGNPAGYSEHLGRNLTAAQRWEFQEVNSNHEHQCADLVEASGKADKIAITRGITLSDIPDLFFPEGAEKFTPFTKPSFTFWDGSNPGFALKSITLNDDGSVSFDADSKDIELSNLEVFQTSALIDWIALGCDSCLVRLDGEALVGVKPYEYHFFSCMIEGLNPDSDHSFSIVSPDGLEVRGEFHTKDLTPGAAPYIYLADLVKNTQNRVAYGSRSPLVVFNAPLCSVSWKIDGKDLEPLPQNRYTFTQSCTLQATVENIDGSVDVLVKRIEVQ